MNPVETSAVVIVVIIVVVVVVTLNPIYTVTTISIVVVIIVIFQCLVHIGHRSQRNVPSNLLNVDLLRLHKYDIQSYHHHKRRAICIIEFLHHN